MGCDTDYGRSFICTRKRRGESTDSSGTPCVKAWGEDCALLMTVHCIRLRRKERTRSRLFAGLRVRVNGRFVTGLVLLAAFSKFRFSGPYPRPLECFLSSFLARLFLCFKLGHLILLQISGYWCCKVSLGIRREQLHVLHRHTSFFQPGSALFMLFLSPVVCSVFISLLELSVCRIWLTCL